MPYRCGEFSALNSVEFRRGTMREDIKIPHGLRPQGTFLFYLLSEEVILLLRISGSCGSCGNSGAGRLDCGYDSALSIEDLKVVVVEATDLDDLTETESGDIDLEDVGEVGGETLDVELAHLDLKLTAGLDALTVTDDLKGHADGHWLVVEDLEEVDMEDVARDGVELDVLKDSLHALAVDGEVNEINVRGVDEATEIDLGDRECNLLLAAVDDARDETTAAELLSGLLATALTLRTFDVKSFHLL